MDKTKCFFTIFLVCVTSTTLWISYFSVKSGITNTRNEIARYPRVCPDVNKTTESGSELFFEKYLRVIGRRSVVHVPVIKQQQGDIGTYQQNYKAPCFFVGESRIIQNVRCLPMLYVLGTIKSGTTEFCNCLNVHKEIVTPPRKEMAYWNSQPKTNLHIMENYISKYQRAAREIFNSSIEWAGYKEYHHKFTYDCSPWYGRHIPFLPQRFKAITPGSKLIFILRHPTDRMFSHYHFECNRLNSTFSPDTFHNESVKEIHRFRECMARDEKRLLRCIRYNSSSIVYLHYSIYFPFIKTWLEYFPPQQMLILKAEEFYNNTADVMDGVFRFLSMGPPDAKARSYFGSNRDQYSVPGLQLKIRREMPDLVEDNSQYEGDHLKQAEVRQKVRQRWKSYEDTIFPETRKLLDDFFEPFNKKLANLLKDDRFLFLR